MADVSRHACGYDGVACRMRKRTDRPIQLSAGMQPLQLIVGQLCERLMRDLCTQAVLEERPYGGLVMDQDKNPLFSSLK